VYVIKKERIVSDRMRTSPALSVVFRIVVGGEEEAIFKGGLIISIPPSAYALRLGTARIRKLIKTD
jgi:hypothetical protein